MFNEGGRRQQTSRIRVLSTARPGRRDSRRTWLEPTIMTPFY